MKQDVPDDHQLGMRVPKGGSDCAKCKYVSDDETSCGNERFVKWNGGKKLPEPADSYCCDLFETKSAAKRSLSEQLQRQKEGK